MALEGEPVWGDAIRSAALTLRVDAVTAEIVSRLRGAGLRPILLKGPSIREWLYTDGTPRPYVDTDLLVAPASLADAERVLVASGFERGQPGWQEVSHSWTRPDGGFVDLHTSLFAVGASAEVLWAELSALTEQSRVGPTTVEILNRPALAFHVALHAAQHGGSAPSVLGDLDRALAVADETCWRAAGALAGRVRASAAFATGLRLRPEGVPVLEKLGLLQERSTLATLHAQGTKPLVLGLEHLAAAPDRRAQLRFLIRELAPPPAYMRAHSALARRGTFGLPLAYMWRPFSVGLRLPAAFAAWRRARRETSDPRAPR